MGPGDDLRRPDSRDGEHRTRSRALKRSSGMLQAALGGRPHGHVGDRRLVGPGDGPRLRPDRAAARRPCGSHPETGIALLAVGSDRAGGDLHPRLGDQSGVRRRPLPPCDRRTGRRLLPSADLNVPLHYRPGAQKKRKSWILRIGGAASSSPSRSSAGDRGNRRARPAHGRGRLFPPVLLDDRQRAPRSVRVTPVTYHHRRPIGEVSEVEVEGAQLRVAIHVDPAFRYAVETQRSVCFRSEGPRTRASASAPTAGMRPFAAAVFWREHGLTAPPGQCKLEKARWRGGSRQR